MNHRSLLVLSAVLALPVGAIMMGAHAATLSPVVAAAESKSAEGTIKSVDTSANSFVLSVGVGNDKKDITVKVTKDTKYTLDGKDSTMDKALVVGNTAKVSHSDNTASKVDAKTPKKP